MPHCDFNYNSSPALYLTVTPLRVCNTVIKKKKKHKLSNLTLHTQYRSRKYPKTPPNQRFTKNNMPKPQLLNTNLSKTTLAYIFLKHSEVLLHWQVKICHHFSTSPLPKESIEPKKNLPLKTVLMCCCHHLKN